MEFSHVRNENPDHVIVTSTTSCSLTEWRQLGPKATATTQLNANDFDWNHEHVTIFLSYCEDFLKKAFM